MEGTMEIIPYPWDDDTYSVSVEQNQQVTQSMEYEAPQSQSKSVAVMAPTAIPARHDVITRTAKHLGKVPLQWKMTNNIKIPGNNRLQSLHWKEGPTRCKAAIKQQQTKGTNKIRDNIIPIIICLVPVFALLTVFLYYMITYMFNQ